MPIKAILEDIHGTRRLESVVDSTGGLNRCLPIDDPSFPLLQYIDPYGNAVFNPKQMPQLIDELDRLVERSSDEASKALLEKVRELALRCLASHHVYLRFVGD